MRNPISIYLRRLGEDERSPQWPATRDHWLKLHPACEFCGLIHDPEVHHRMPFHLAPWLELDTRNFITLGESIGHNCHLNFGHLGNWKTYNPDLVTPRMFD